ncbi:MAG: DUF6527 family protein [Acidimicrobiales bacterium]
MKRHSLTHEFVDDIPAQLEDETLYVSIRYRTVVHLCACGCRSKVVTPIKPAKWHLTFDGATISLSPSIGNWQFPCRSHYWIRNNEVRWARPWTDEQIREGRERDARELHGYYEDREPAQAGRVEMGDATQLGMFARIRRWLRHR